MSSPIRLCFWILAATLAASLPAFSQAANTDYKITAITPSFVESPIFSGTRYDKRGAKTRSWLEVEVAFEWQPRVRDPKNFYTNELTFNYYILLANKSALYPTGTLLTGAVTHVSIPPEKDLHAVAYVPPRALELFFGGKAPANAQQAILDVGVTISKGGQVVASSSWKSKSGEWWPQFQATTGHILNKDETPFAPLAWDYYEALKTKGPGAP